MNTALKAIIIVFLLSLALFLSSCQKESLAEKYAVPLNSQCEASTNEDVCYRILAFNTTNVGYCLHINADSFRRTCMSTIAVMTKKVETCDLVNSTILRASCERQVAIATQNLDSCRRIKPSGINDIAVQNERDACFKSIAVVNSNLAICDNIGSAQIRDEGCYTEIAAKKNDSSICDKIKSIPFMQKCWGRFAITTNNASMCQKYTSVPLRTSCLVIVSTKGRNGESCSNEQIEFGTCYNSVAYQNLNESLCDLSFDSEYSRTLCRGQISSIVTTIEATPD